LCCTKIESLDWQQGIVVNRLISVMVLLALIPGCSREDAQTGVESVAEPAAATEERESELVQPRNWWDILPRPVYATLEKVGEFQDWFQVYRLPDGTLAIYEGYQFEEALMYLVVGTERAVLIDTGTGIGDLDEVVAELTDLPVEVINTHEHYDHAGGNYRFDKTAAFDDQAALKRLADGRSAESMTRYKSDEYVIKPYPDGFDVAAWHIPSHKPSRLLHDGDAIDLGSRRLEVIHIPGHSPGSIALLDRENRVLFTGDHFFPGPLYCHADDVEIEKYVASNRKLAEMVDLYDYVLSGHNDPWVQSDVIPRVSEAFNAIFSGGGEYAEDADGLRRYRFDGFDVLMTAQMAAEHAPD